MIFLILLKITISYDFIKKSKIDYNHYIAGLKDFEEIEVENN